MWIEHWSGLGRKSFWGRIAPRAIRGPSAYCQLIRLTLPVLNPAALLVEVKYGAECDVDLHESVRGQAACEVAEALRIDGGGLLDQYADILAEEFDGGMDHGSE